MQVVFHDNGLHKAFCPLTLTRPVCDLFFGMRTIRESWMGLLELNARDAAFHTEEYLQKKFPKPDKVPGIIVAGNIKPDRQIANWVKNLRQNEQLIINGRWVASGCTDADVPVQQEYPLLFVEHPVELFQKLEAAMRNDFVEMKKFAKLMPDDTNHIIGNEISIAANAKIMCSIINTQTGPVFIDEGAEVMEGSMIRGPFYLGKGSTVKMGTKIYGATAIGPGCKVGGEISNSIVHGYSNKAHDGFLGNSILGEWCNLGADTNTSNLKNNYSEVKFHSYETGQMEQTNSLFMGVVMGDHSKTGINTMLNTATSIGVSSNVFGEGFPPKYIPSFAWGGFSDENFELPKAIELAKKVMGRRNLVLQPEDIKILTYLHGMAQ